MSERHYPRSVGTLPNKGNNNDTVLQGAFKRESPQKPTKPIRSSTISTNVTTEKQLSHSRLGTDIFQGKWSVLIADWQMSLV
jgi:hypothetical protein